ncbi:SusC/RagA family TonB-linked outer membrane protein [Chitinophaga sancti]|uniref:SusC/RagA family TonB-linked outer membrane protein n=1 Tax=Chitinophaga sancti TaxID=1004 RepID=A0A1K1PGE8_9BACT|nr:SusC/RagA family TonB-linked outer membrane protein [Chitinophaga sancti]WQD65874.1 SusC/RagA family TonB-linked outer membrane protein [Chitinophaga sancti]WQG88504.1 SusC/RagA family TonB-linked outer membrane protein [Chitinophaga sancti]SFW46553.1 TonB-linked outer membrane protein, SusC/RagA family [Chitinophaga sancti]
MRIKGFLCLMVLMCHVFTFSLFAQSTKVTGTVKDESGQSIPGATIKIRGGGGTVADIDGTFTIMANKGQKLIITAVGYETKEVAVDGAPIHVQLGNDKKILTEFVVTGTGSPTSRRKLGISVESVSAEKLAGAATSIDQALVGKIPGAQISTVSGNPSDPVNILLRGVNTIQGGTRPLIILDGVQVAATDFNSLDLSNVERVEVIQGAASAALYGAQGANGVIQLFTKKGRAGKMEVNYSTSYSFNNYINSGGVTKANKHPWLTDANNNVVDANGNLLALDKYGDYSGISYSYGGATRYAMLNPNNVADKPYNMNLKYYDHFKEMFLTGSTWNNAINFSGGTDKTDFNMAFANNHTLSPVMHNGYVDRTNLTANIGTEVFKGFHIRSATQVIYTKNTLTPGLGAPGGYLYGRGNVAGNVNNIYSFLNTSPFFSLKWKMADGHSPAFQTADFLSINAFNPYYVQEYASGLDNKIDIVQSVNANYQINHFLELDAKYGINYRNERATWTYLNQTGNANAVYWDTKSSNFASDRTGEIDQWNYTTTFQNFLGSAYFRTDFKKDFGWNLPIQTTTLASYDYRQRKYREYDIYGLGLPTTAPINLASASALYVAPMSSSTTEPTNGDYQETFVTFGYLIDQKIDIGDWAGVSGGFRSDWSSTFGSGTKPFTFPHVNGYILPSSFNFWNGLEHAIPYFKIRSAYGEAGTQPGVTDRYPTLNQGALGSGLYYSNPATAQNPNLKVEVSKEFEVGTDFSVTLFNGDWLSAVNGSFTYWTRKAQNVIYRVSAALSTGGTSVLTNAIDMSSKGIQFQVNLPVYKSRDFSWDFTTNFGKQTSMIDNIRGGADIILTSAAGSTALTLTAGRKIGQIYGYKALKSLDAVKGNGGKYISDADRGKYEIVEGRVVDTATKAIQFEESASSFGDPNPKFNASFINQFTYKNFLTLSFQFDWVYGSHLYNQTKEWMYRDGIDGDFSKPVTINGRRAAYTAYYGSAYSSSWGSLYGPGNNATKDYFYEDASFLRLRNVSLGFDLARFLHSQKFNKLQVIFTGRNLLTVTKYNGFDPEISSGAANSSFDRGIDHSTIPNMRSYQVGLNVGF